MRSFDKRKSDTQRHVRWDEGVQYLDVPHPSKSSKDHKRLVGPVQDISQHWVLPDAAAFAEEVRKEARAARKEGRAPKALRRPPGFPVMCPRFDPVREIYVDFRDPATGNCYRASEVCKKGPLVKAGIKLPKGAEPDQMYAKASLDTGRAIPVEKVFDPLFEHFNMKADKRTYWFAIDRAKQRKSKGADCVGVVNRGGIPFTAWTGVERIGEALDIDPSDPDKGWDLAITKNTDKGVTAASMWGVIQIKPTPLTAEEKKMVFGKYKLADGTIVGYMEILRLEAEEPKKLKGMKTLVEAALLPLHKMAKTAMITGEELHQKLIECGYYLDAEGTEPRPELVFVDTKAKNWGKKDSAADDDDDDDDVPAKKKAKKRREVEEPDEDDAPVRGRKEKPTKKGKSAKRGRVSTLLD